MSRVSALLALAVVLVAPPADAKKVKTSQLLRVISPIARRTAPAHPFVNVIVRFGKASDGSPADPATFRARLGKVPLPLEPIVEGGQTVGMRGTIAHDLLKIGPRRNNRLRFDVRTVAKGPKNKVRRDIDRVRFRAVDAEDQGPTARLITASDVVFPDIGTQFDGSDSHDPESDALAYHWEWNDGTPPSDEASPLHIFPAGTADVTVSLTVSDGTKTASEDRKLIACAPLDAGKVPGMVQVSGNDSVEFGATTTPVSRTFNISNISPDSASQVHVQMGIEDADFSVDPPDVRIAAGQTVPITLTFTPGAPGHRMADVAIVACASNRDVLHVLAHGYSGNAAGNGPTGSSETAFFNLFGVGTSLYLPSGQRLPANNVVHTCLTPQNGLGTGDACVVDADCASNGGTCDLSTSLLFDPVDLCADGTGGVYLMSDEGAYSDPNPDPNSDVELSVDVLRMQFDANGTKTGATIVRHTTDATTQLACDGVAAADGGRFFMAEGESIVLDAACFRDAVERLVAVRKDNGSSPPPLLSRIDAVEGLDLCDGDVDPVADLEVSRDGSAVFASLSDSGLYQLRPVQRFITPDVNGSFQIHPDGSLIIVTATDNGTRGSLNLYKVFPEQAADGAVRLADLSPCATFPLPNNRALGNTTRTTFIGEHSYAIGRTAPGSLDGTVLVSFFTTGGILTSQGQPRLLPIPLRVQGVVAFNVPAGAPTCGAPQLINLDLVDQLSF